MPESTAITEIIESGVAEVTNKGKKVVFRSMRELKEAQGILSGAANPADTGFEPIEIQTENPYLR